MKNLTMSTIFSSIFMIGVLMLTSCLGLVDIECVTNEECPLAHTCLGGQCVQQMPTDIWDGGDAILDTTDVVADVTIGDTLDAGDDSSPDTDISDISHADTDVMSDTQFDGETSDTIGVDVVDVSPDTIMSDVSTDSVDGDVFPTDTIVLDTTDSGETTPDVLITDVVDVHDADVASDITDTDSADAEEETSPDIIDDPRELPDTYVVTVRLTPLDQLILQRDMGTTLYVQRKRGSSAWVSISQVGIAFEALPGDRIRILNNVGGYLTSCGEIHIATECEWREDCTITYPPLVFDVTGRLESPELGITPVQASLLCIDDIPTSVRSTLPCNSRGQTVVLIGTPDTDGIFPPYQGYYCMEQYGSFESTLRIFFDDVIVVEGETTTRLRLTNTSSGDSFTIRWSSE